MAIKPPSLRSISKHVQSGFDEVRTEMRSAAKTVSTSAKNTVQRLSLGADRFDDLFAKPASNLWQAISQPQLGLDVAGIADLVNGLDLKAARKVLEAIFPPKIRDAEGDQLVAQTQGFRASLAEVRRLERELSGLPKEDPRHAEVTQALRAAEGRLQAATGYTAASAPAAGALWLDPQFLHRELPDGKVHASEFPTGNPVTRPPAPLDFLFGEDKGRRFSLDKGSSAQARELVGVSGGAAYKAQVAKNRAEAGMPVTDGEPVGVHVTFQGGGGKGKRYAAALAEMYSLGVVPTSLSGSSAGAIAAALTSTGADPAQLNAFVTDPRLTELFDLDLRPDDGGLMNGNAAFDVIDEKLRELTGINDRPVTFADLKVPLKIYAAKTYDSAPEPGTEDLTKVENRLFAFSQETTPDTPVVLAVRASMAIPGLFDPVQMVDPTTGRKVHLVDGGALDNLPVGNPFGLPEVGLSLLERNDNHPKSAANNAPRGPLPGGNLDASHIVWNAFNGYALLKEGGVSADDFRNRTRPEANQFMLSLPVWDLKDPSKSNSTLGFGYEPDVDPALDVQTRALTRTFFKSYLDDLRVKGARGTNVVAELPKDVRFEVPVTVGGKAYTASYAGGDKVVLTDAAGKKQERDLGKERIEAIYLDHLAFGDLSAQLSHDLARKKNLFDWL